MNVRRWLHEHSLKLLAIRDTPQAIAGGVAIGIFFGFTPLFGLKTLCAIGFAWLTRSNIIAAVVAVALHDVLLPFMPVVYRWEYDVGFWLMSSPHAWPPPLHRMRLEGHPWRHWTTFFNVGKPLLVGSVVLGVPVAIATYVITVGIVTKHQRRRDAHLAANPPEEANPS
jgi:uncharacterized protein (DUF2062 family)